MPILLHHFPILEQKRTVFFQGQELLLKPDQLAVWVSLSMDKKTPGTRLFPALIDTGFGYTFAINVDHLQGWSRLAPNFSMRSIRLNGIVYARAPHVYLWLYRTWSISAHDLAGECPVFLDTGRAGLAVNAQRVPRGDVSSGTAPGRAFPRIPIIGMKTHQQNHLRLFVDAWRSRFSLYQGRIWP